MYSNSRRHLRLTLTLLVLSLLAAVTAQAGEAPGVPSFPLPLESYGDASMPGLWDILVHRVRMQPLNLWASLLFVGAVLHTFFTHKFHHLAGVLEERHREKLRLSGDAPDDPDRIFCGKARLFHFLGEVEAVFGIWVVPLMLMLAFNVGIKSTLDYVEKSVNYDEALFVVVIMAISSTRPVLRLAEQCLEVLPVWGAEGPRPGGCRS
jgi:hypothetical protein